jgi:lipopolysaccharide export system permease protein
VLRVAWPVLLVVALLSLFVWPWVNQKSSELRERYERRSDLSRITPGQFQTSRDGSRTFFIERDSEDGRTGRNVFILAQSGPKGERESVTSARSGRIELRGDDRFLVLDKGQRNEQDLAGGDKTLARFETYSVLAGERAAQRASDLPPRARSTLDLLIDPNPRHQGELAWRLGLVFGSANLLLLAVPLSASNPRRASNWNLLFALLGFVVYYNVINLTQAWVASSKVEMGAALIGAHGTAFVLALGMIWWRESGNARAAWRARRRAAGAA